MECKLKYGTINYEVFGEGHAIIILHSMGTDLRSMSSWLEPVFTNQINWKRIYIDLPAHGFSKINHHVKGSEEMVSNIIDFIEQIIPNKPFSLLGMSFGGYLAQGILHKKRKLGKGLCLIAPAIHKQKRELPAKVVLSTDEQVLNELPEEISIAIKTLMVNQTEEKIALFLKEIQPGRTLANRNFLASDWRKNDYFFKEEPLSDVNEVTIPTLVLLGRQDSITGYADHLDTFSKYQHATFTIIDGAGHLLPIDKRELTSNMIVDWLSRVKKNLS